MIDLDTPVADTDPDLDVVLVHAGVRWTLARFGGDALLISEVVGARMLLLDPNRIANAKVVTLLDAVEAAIEECAPRSPSGSSAP